MLDATLDRHTTELLVRTELEATIAACDEFPMLVSVPLLCDPLEWLASQTQSPRIGWSDRSGESTIAGCGLAMQVDCRPGQSADAVLRRCRELLQGHDELRFYGGFAFTADAPVAPEWQAFGPGKFWLPRFVHDGQRLSCVVLNRSDRNLALHEAQRLQILPAATRVADGCWSRRQDEPDQIGWQQNIERAMELLETEVLEKIVLARKATFTFHAPVPPIQLVKRLADSTCSCYHFCFEPCPGTAFVGATPERLFQRRGRRVLSEVVAGTRRRDLDPALDRQLAAELLASAKDQLEHDIVRKSIKQRLHPYVEALEVDARASVLKLARKQHLYSGIRGQLKPQVSDGELIERLHPTPAVGGYPTENALAEIARLEPFARGWYAAPVGWIGAEEAEFAVAIRSGLIRDQELSLFSGAGVVAGSTAQEEWQEIEHKIVDFLDVLHRKNT